MNPAWEPTGWRLPDTGNGLRGFISPYVRMGVGEPDDPAETRIYWGVFARADDGRYYTAFLNGRPLDGTARSFTEAQRCVEAAIRAYGDRRAL